MRWEWLGPVMLGIYLAGFMTPPAVRWWRGRRERREAARCQRRRQALTRIAE